MHHLRQRGAPRQAVQNRDLWSSDTPAMDQLQDLLRQRRAAHEPVADLEACAQERHRLLVAAEREAWGPALARCDLAVPALAVEGERDQRVWRCAATSTSAVGPVRVARSVSRHPQSSPAVCPLERRAGIIEGSWTPWAATPATWVVAQVTPKAGEELVALWGHMTPSQSPRDR